MSFNWSKFRAAQMIDIAQNPGQPIPSEIGKALIYFARQAPLVLGLMILFYGLTALFNALIPYFIGTMIDVMTGTPGAADSIWPAFTGLVVFGLILSPIASTGGDYFTFIVFVSRFGNLVRRQGHRDVIRHALSYFQDDFAGRIANKVNQMGPAVRDIYRGAIGAVFYVLVFAVVTTVLLASADIRLIWPMMLWIVLYAGLLILYIPRIRSKSLKLASAQSHVMGRVVDSYTNILSVKLFARGRYEDQAVVEALDKHSERFEDKGWQVYGMNVLTYWLNSIMIFIISLAAILLWQKGDISPGQVAMVIPLMVQVKHQLQWIKWEVTHIFEYLGTTEDSLLTITKPVTVTDKPSAKDLKVSKGEIIYDNITFHYGKETGIIDNLSLTVPAGQKVGLVGHSGAGKSTLVNLLLRFYDLESGRILIDGQDIAAHSQDSLRHHIAMVTQDTSLLHRSILDNIRYGRPEASMEEVVAAAQKAQAHDFIEELEDNKGRTGYEVLVGERGVKLSGGQRQRIAIARVILKNAPILILDEATAALDSEVESYIQAQLVHLMEGHTVIAIAHRLSTIAHLDRLVVMKEGRIIEDGTHEELLKENGHYARMWALQSGGFLPQ